MAIYYEYERGIAEMKQENVFFFRLWDCERTMKVKDVARCSTSSDERFPLLLREGATEGRQSTQSLVR